jgi:hypothetical protein
VPRAADGRIVLAVDVSNWLRPEAPTSPDLLFCHVYGRGRSADQFIPGWPYSFVAALETGRTSWTAVLDAIRLGPADDATAVTAAQLRDVVTRLVQAGPWKPGDQDILIVMDAGYDVTRLAYVLADLPVELVGRLRSDRVPLGLVARAHLGDHAHRTTPQLSRIRGGTCHDAILSKNRVSTEPGTVHFRTRRHFRTRPTRTVTHPAPRGAYSPVPWHLCCTDVNGRSNRF